MKKIALHLLLCIALVCQGITGVFAATASEIVRGGCCPHWQLDGTHHECPCPQKQHCTSDCQLLCASSSGLLIGAAAFVATPISGHAVQDSLRGTAVHARADSPPI